MNILAYVHLRNIFGSTGAGRVARQMTEALTRTGLDEVRILADRRDHEEILPKVGPPWTDYDYSLFSADTSRQQKRWVFMNNPKAENYWPEADVMYCTAESFVPTRRAKSVNLIHDAAFFEPHAHEHMFRHYLQGVKWRLLFSRIGKNADVIQTVSHFSAERLEHYFPSFRGRLHVVHNGIPEIFFSDETGLDAAILEKFDLSERPFILLPRGLFYRKNAELVLKAWPLFHTLHPTARLVITSHNDPAYVEQALQMPNVQLTGFVEDTELRALYRYARAVWFPSRYEGFGLPALEAMACGTPVVASNAASLPEIMGTVGLLADVNSPQEHVESLEYVFEDSADRVELVNKGKKWASRFTWDRAATTLRKAFV